MVKKQSFGSLYLNGAPVEVGSKYAGQEVTIGDTVPGMEIPFVGVNGVFIGSYCICSDINWESLEKCGITAGVHCSIDGKEYLCRLLQVGAAPDEPNEWDAALDAAGEDDDLWHCKEMPFWGQDVSAWNPSCRAVRGCPSARSWHSIYTTKQNVHVGFRPVLVPLSADNQDSDVGAESGRKKLTLAELEKLAAGDRIFITAKRQTGFAMDAQPCLVAPTQLLDNFCAVTWRTRESHAAIGALWAELPRAKYDCTWYAESDM